jgi:hypothetical protein
MKLKQDITLYIHVLTFVHLIVKCIQRLITLKILIARVNQQKYTHTYSLQTKIIFKNKNEPKIRKKRAKI